MTPSQLDVLAQAPCTAHALGHEAFRVRVDGLVLRGDQVGGRLGLPADRGALLAERRGGDRPLRRGQHGGQVRAELKHVNREIRRLRAELAELEERRAKPGSDLGT
jgi:hypothetical protein